MTFYAKSWIRYMENNLYIFDMDGTILDENKRLSEEFVYTLSEMRKNKVLYTIASGRSYNLIEPYLKELNLKIPFIANNGATIYLGQKLIFCKYIDRFYIGQVFKIIIQNDLTSIIYTNDKTLYFEGTTDAKKFLERFNNNYISIEKNELMSIVQDIIKITFIEKNVEKVETVKASLNSIGLAYKLDESEKNIYVLTNRNATKGLALKYLCNYLNIEEISSIVFGDNYNDLSMFEVAGMSVAMKNAPNIVREKADKVTSYTNNENGVVQFLTQTLKEGK